MSNRMLKNFAHDVTDPIGTFALPLLRFYRLRYWVVRLRYAWLKRSMRFADFNTPQIGTKTISHNLSAFKHPRAVFGCGGRMGLLIHPIVGYFTREREKQKILAVGCRTEDDVYWLRAYGFRNTYGFDLFSYSKNIIVGDIHRTAFPDNTYDVVLLGWVLSYSKDPGAIIKECKRILKPGGLLGIGIEHNPLQDTEGPGLVRSNLLNSTADVIALLNENMAHKIVFEYDHYGPKEHGSVVITKLFNT